VTLALVDSWPAAPQSLAERAYREIRTLIVTLELAPGSVISETDLQERLGMGRTPIREALRSLADERLIEVYPRRGMFVTGVDARDLSALSEVREILEPQAARIAAQRHTDADAQQMRELLAAIDDLVPDQRALIELDQRIHQVVYRGTQNPFLIAALDEHYMHALRIWFMALDRITDLAQAIREHRAILEAILLGDPERSAQAMSRHVAGFETQIQRIL
jgi:DNA-binding GntR family transcriptional regulator